MKEHVDKIILVDVADLIGKRVNDLEKAINSNNFNNFMDAFIDYANLEKTMKSSGYSKSILNSRKRIYEVLGLSDIRNMKFK